MDVLLADQLPDCSRAAAIALIRRQCVQVNSGPAKPARHIKAGDHISGCIPEPEICNFAPEPLPLHILFEDEALVILNKAPGMVVHPAPGNHSGTLVNALLHHFQALATEGFSDGRPGIVHRLDKDTSGIMVAAKTAAVGSALMLQFKDRQVSKHYTALVHGRMEAARGLIEAPLGRHPVERKRMSVNSRRARAARTAWQVQKFFTPFNVTLLNVQPATGRTHQIRVHLAARQHPLLGDALYGHRGRDQHLGDIATLLTRQMLHAQKLGFTHPVSGKYLEWEAPLPEDMLIVMARLGRDQQ